MIRVIPGSVLCRGLHSGLRRARLVSVEQRHAGACDFANWCDRRQGSRMRHMLMPIVERETDPDVDV